MAFPSIAATNTTVTGSSTDGLSINMPSGISAGHLLVVLVAQDLDATITQSGGSDWTVIDCADDGKDVTLAILAKVAEGSDTLTIASTDGQDGAVVALRIIDHGVTTPSSDIYIGTAATGNSTEPNPPSCSPGLGIKDFLWIEAYAADDDDETDPWESSTYTQGLLVESDQSADSCTVAYGYREGPVSAEDPGVMYYGASEQWVAQTIAIQPAAAGNDQIYGTSTAAATVADADLNGKGALHGTVTAAATVSAADLNGKGAIHGTSTAAATVSDADLNPWFKMHGTSAAAATVADADLNGAGALHGTSTALATATADLDGDAAIHGTSTAAATTTADLDGDGALHGTSAGAATVADADLNADGALRGTSTAAATVGDADLNADGALHGTAAGAATVADADLNDAAGTSPLYGTANGVATVGAADLNGTGALYATLAVAATTTADLDGTGYLYGTAAGAATVPPALAYLKFIGRADAWHWALYTATARIAATASASARVTRRAGATARLTARYNAAARHAATGHASAWHTT